MRYPNDDLALWVEAHVRAESGIWTARLCRLLNGIPEDEGGIVYCGLCSDYANPRKRNRAERWATVPTLPGMKPPFQLHSPCTTMPLRKLQYLLYVLWDKCDLVYGMRERIPDVRQPRGWDWGTRWYARP